MPKLLPRTVQTPSCVQEPGLATARENTAWPCAYKSQVNETVSARGHILTMKSGLWGHFSHWQHLLAEMALGKDAVNEALCSAAGTSPQWVTEAREGFQSSTSTSSLLEGTDTALAQSCQGLILPLSQAGVSGRKVSLHWAAFGSPRPLEVSWSILYKIGLFLQYENGSEGTLG